MIERLGALIENLSMRERVMLGFLVLIVLPVATIFLVVLPLNAAVKTQNTALADAQKEQQWVQSQTMQAKRLGLGQVQSSRQVQDPLGLSGLEESLRNARLRQSVGRMANREQGAVEISFEQVEFSQLANWVNANQDNWGYDIQTFRIDKHTRTGFVDAEFYMEPQQ